MAETEQDWNAMYTAKDIDGNEPGGCSLTFRGNLHDEDAQWVSGKIGDIMISLDAKRRAREGKTKNREYHLIFKRLPPA